MGSLSPLHALLMWRAPRQLKQVERRLEQAAKNIREARANLETATGKRGREYEAGLAREQQLLAEAEQLQQEYLELKQKLEGPE